MRRPNSAAKLGSRSVSSVMVILRARSSFFISSPRALVNHPKVLLADEPTGNLDSKTSQSIMELLQAIRKRLGTTMIVVTHDPRVAAWADRVIQLEDGKVVS